MTQCPWTLKNSSAFFELRNKDESKTERKAEELIHPKRNCLTGFMKLM